MKSQSLFERIFYQTSKIEIKFNCYGCGDSLYQKPFRKKREKFRAAHRKFQKKHPKHQINKRKHIFELIFTE
jgi:hypothetical protein